MPQRHKYPSPLERDYTPARTMRERWGLENGVFRCDRCHRVMPEAVAVEQDGLTVCPLDRDKTSKSDLELLLAEQTSETDDYAPCEDPATAPFVDAVVVTAFDVTWPVTLVNDGAAVPITVTGIGFTSSLSLSYGDAGITDDSAPVITSTQVDLSLVASGVTPGYYTITIDGTRYFNVLHVID